MIVICPFKGNMMEASSD